MRRSSPAPKLSPFVIFAPVYPAIHRGQRNTTSIGCARTSAVNSFTESPLLGLSQRLPPSNVAAEQALLGALLANNRAYERVSDFLAPEHFADPINGRIFQAVARRIDQNQIADPITLRGEFEHSGILDEVGGTAYLRNC